jgi:hypothetical protein
MNDMLLCDAQKTQQMQQERLKADEALKNKLQGLFESQAFALNAASKAASAFDYNTTSAATEAAAGACFYSRCVVPPRCTYLLYSTSLKMPICRIHNPIPYVSTPPSRWRKGSEVETRPQSGAHLAAACQLKDQQWLHHESPQFSRLQISLLARPSTSYSVELSSPMLKKKT